MEVPKQSGKKYCSACYDQRRKDVARLHYKKHVEDGTIKEYRRRARHKQRIRYQDDRVRLVDRAKTRAKYKGVPCSIRPEDLTIPDLCPILGTVFQKCSEYAMSIDEIIPGLGYVKDNVQIISMKANAMKNSATREELVKFAEWVLNNEG